MENLSEIAAKMNSVLQILVPVAETLERQASQGTPDTQRCATLFRVARETMKSYQQWLAMTQKIDPATN